MDRPCGIDLIPRQTSPMRQHGTSADGMAQRLKTEIHGKAQPVGRTVVHPLMDGQTGEHQYVAALEFAGRPRAAFFNLHAGASRAVGAVGRQFAQLVRSRQDGQPPQFGGTISAGNPGGPRIEGSLDVNKILMGSSYSPLIVKNSNRKAYFNRFEKSTAGNPVHLKRFLLNCFKATYREFFANL